MQVTLESEHIKEVLKLSKASEIGIMVTKNKTLIIAHNEELNSLKEQVVKKINVGGEEGEILIDRKVLELITDGEVTLTETEILNNGRTITFESKEKVEEPIEVREHLLTLKGHELRELLTCNYATSKDTSREILTGVCIDKNSFAALNGVMLSVRKGTFNVQEQVLLSRSLLNVLKKIKTEEEIKIYFNENYVQFHYESIRITGKRIKGEFIDYSNMLPREDAFKTIAMINIQELVKVLKLAKKINTNYIKLIFKDSKLQIEVKGWYSISIKEEIQGCMFLGEDLEIAFNTNYLLEVLKQYKSVAKFNFITNVSAAVLSYENKIDLILPLRLTKLD